MRSQDIFEGILEQNGPYRGRVAIISTLWNAELVDQMVSDARAVLTQHLAKPNIIEYKVAGTIELAAAASQVARLNTYAGIIIVGAVIRGDTPHFDYVCQNITTATAIINTDRDSLTPVIFGVLTVDNEEQANDRVYGKNGHQKKGELDAKSLLIQMNFRKNRKKVGE